VEARIFAAKAASDMPSKFLEGSSERRQSATAATTKLYEVYVKIYSNTIRPTRALDWEDLTV